MLSFHLAVNGMGMYIVFAMTQDMSSSGLHFIQVEQFADAGLYLEWPKDIMGHRYTQWVSTS